MVADVEEAARWGAPCSVWPIAQEFAYSWNSERRLFYPTDGVSAAVVARELCHNTQLAHALVSGGEIMFSVPSFLAVPMSFDETLRQAVMRDAGL
mmetsp:Transcript_14281/g.38291  ORF Transcript_14281/g.38291 Transcript_14281/m.38291 type:complete len:95 (-) Transcript_14281:651-935(-)